MNRQVKTWDTQLKILVARTSGKTGAQLKAHRQLIEAKRMQTGEKRRTVDMFFPNRTAQIIAYYLALFIQFASATTSLKTPPPK